MAESTKRISQLATAVAVVGLLAGCATVTKEQLDEVKATAEQAQRDAAEAKSLAKEANAKASTAQSTADEAMRSAEEAKAQSEATDAKIDNMFKKAMQK